MGRGGRSGPGQGGHWPELTEYLELDSVTLEELLLSFGSPAALSVRAEEGRERMRRISRGRLDELDRRHSRLLDRRYALSGLPEHKDLKHFDWSYNPHLPKRDLLELATLKFIDAKEDVLAIGSPGVGKSHAAKAIALLAVRRGDKVFYREARDLIEEITQARELGDLRKYRTQLHTANLLIIDDLFIRKLPVHAGDELPDVLMGRYEKRSTIVTSNRPLEDWAKLLGDVVVVTPLLDRLMHRGHLLRFDGKSWRLKESAARLAKRAQTA